FAPGSLFAAGGTLSWALDLSPWADFEVADAQAQQETLRGRLILRDARRQIEELYDRAQALGARARAAQAEQAASTRAAQIAADEFNAGRVSQLDVVQAQRDAFQASALWAQAAADLAYTRAALRIITGNHP